MKRVHLIGFAVRALLGVIALAAFTGRCGEAKPLDVSVTTEQEVSVQWLEHVNLADFPGIACAVGNSDPGGYISAYFGREGIQATHQESVTQSGNDCWLSLTTTFAAVGDWNLHVSALEEAMDDANAPDATAFPTPGTATLTISGNAAWDFVLGSSILKRTDLLMEGWGSDAFADGGTDLSVVMPCDIASADPLPVVLNGAKATWALRENDPVPPIFHVLTVPNCLE